MQLTRPPLVIGRNEPCFCGSGERFRRCCGSSQPDRKPPAGIVVEEDFLSPAECAAILEVAQQQDSSRLKLLDLENSTAKKAVYHYDDKRITRRVDMSDHQAMLDDPVVRVINSRIEPVMNCRVEWFEEPHILRYEPGGVLRFTCRQREPGRSEQPLAAGVGQGRQHTAVPGQRL